MKKRTSEYPKNVFKGAIKLASYLCDPLVFEFRDNGLNEEQIRNLDFLIEKHLYEREQKIFNLRFKENKLLKEISGEVDLSISAVSIIIQEILYKVILNPMNIKYIYSGKFTKNPNPTSNIIKNDNVYDLDISKLGISDPIIRNLNRNNIFTIGELKKVIINGDIYDIKCVSIKSATIILCEMYNAGL